MELNLEIGTPEARWAIGLARELMNARVIAGQEMTGPGPLPAVFVDALNRAVQEVLGDDESSWEESSLRRCAYLIAAQASVGHAAVVTAGTTMEEGASPRPEKGLNKPWNCWRDRWSNLAVRSKLSAPE